MLSGVRSPTGMGIEANEREERETEREREREEGAEGEDRKGAGTVEGEREEREQLTPATLPPTSCTARRCMVNTGTITVTAPTPTNKRGVYEEGEEASGTESAQEEEWRQRGDEE